MVDASRGWCYAMDPSEVALFFVFSSRLTYLCIRVITLVKRFWQTSLYIFSKHYLPASSAIEDLDATLLFFEDIFLEAGAGGASSTLTDLERGWGSGCWGCSEAAEETESSVLETLLEIQASLFEDSSSESSSISRGPSPSSEEELEPVDEVDS